MDLDDKVIVITGGARMGAGIAHALALSGARIVLTYRKSKDAAQEIAQTISARFRPVHLVRCDMSRPADIDGLSRNLKKKFSRCDGLVHLASEYSESLWDSPTYEQDFQRYWDVHVASTMRLARALSPLMTGKEGGRMVCVSDWTAASGRPRYKNFSPYYVSKAGVKALVESLALELAPRILVNAIAPGPILPPPGMSANEIRAVEKATPLQRWGGVAEIVKTVQFLLESNFVSGETIRVDGGRHLS